jgi:hypothetical protein
MHGRGDLDILALGVRQHAVQRLGDDDRDADRLEALLDLTGVDRERPHPGLRHRQQVGDAGLEALQARPLSVGQHP